MLWWPVHDAFPSVPAAQKGTKPEPVTNPRAPWHERPGGRRVTALEDSLAEKRPKVTSPPPLGRTDMDGQLAEGWSLLEMVREKEQLSRCQGARAGGTLPGANPERRQEGCGPTAASKVRTYRFPANSTDGLQEMQTPFCQKAKNRRISAQEALGAGRAQPVLREQNSEPPRTHVSEVTRLLPGQSKEPGWNVLERVCTARPQSSGRISGPVPTVVAIYLPGDRGQAI